MRCSWQLRRWRTRMLKGVCLLVSAPALLGQEAADFFRQNCISCHTIGGGRLTGPDLKGVSQRAERDWLVRFLVNPQAVIDRGDAYAQKLLQESRGVVMPQISGMNPARAEAIVDLIDAESKLEKSQFIGVQITDRPFTAAEVETGRQIFRGERSLKNNGPACLSCHTAQNLGGLSGGQLGPDLTRAFERMEGRKTLAAWLGAPATPTMAPVFKKHPIDSEEILPIIAFLENQAAGGGEDLSAGKLTFLLVGLGGAGLMLVVFDLAWRTRFRSVRKQLVLSSTGRGEE